jgi:hypothetical protein
MPDRIAVAGDWHASTRWAVTAIADIAAQLDGEPEKIILHLGDFGYWPGEPGGGYYLRSVSEALKHYGMYVDFLDGNHEGHEALNTIRDFTSDVAVPVFPRIRWLPRGTRWVWHGRTWLALGGAVSVDKGLRDEGVDWFPEEAITPEQAAQVSAQGHADVMVTHDCPAGVNLGLPVAPLEWLPQIPAAEAHRELLQTVVDAVQPSYLMHGHYHLAYTKPVAMGHGTVQVTGLACDGMAYNWHILNVRTMEWE